MSTSESNAQLSRPADHDPPSAEPVLEQPFDLQSLVSVRAAIAAHADRLGLPPVRVQELVLVTHELAGNAVRHGGGHGRLRLMTDDTSIVVEISDDGPGFVVDENRLWRPAVDALGGRGLWLAHHLCDTFTVASGPTGTVARASMTIRG